MKALILSAGLGTRLRPHTEKIPKPLFPIAGRPLLDIHIDRLQQAGCKEIIVNTHHLHHNIETFILSRNYALPVYIRYEPDILGTGGAIRNTVDFWDNHPFIVINSDIDTNIDIKGVYNFHLSHCHPATLVLHDYPEFNSVEIDTKGFITAFHSGKGEAYCDRQNIFAFTGIQVLDPDVLAFIPGNGYYSSIDMYRNMIDAGKKPKATISTGHYWYDIGTPEHYSEAVLHKMTPRAFACLNAGYGQHEPQENIQSEKLSGDGSDRKWHRMTSGVHSLILADHGIKSGDSVSEVDSFISIGRHLKNKGIPVPGIYLYDTFSGLVFLEDLGDMNLQTRVLNAGSRETVLSLYTSLIDLIINMSIRGAEEFNPAWTYQTPEYSKDLIIEKECRYFVDAYVNLHLNMPLVFEELRNEFSLLADKTLEFSTLGFMHRDMQSRNIMIKDNRFYFIDFQGGRLGPLQYDIASLLIDPYVALPLDMQAQLLDYCTEKLSSRIRIDKTDFLSGYRYCAVTRNLQMLGAFGYLVNVKKKSYFRQYMPAALRMLRHNVGLMDETVFPRLKAVVKNLPMGY